MCIAIPMKVVSSQGLSATCESDQKTANVTLELTGPVAPGAWVLVFQGAAQRVMTEAEARQALSALRALSAVMAGDASRDEIDAAFSDIAARTGELPECLRRAPRESSREALRQH